MGASPISRPIPLAGRAAPSARLLRLASDERLVEHVRKGSQAAFEVIYDRHHRGILAFCRHMLRSQEEAEDALQHTFISAYRDLVGSGKRIQLRAWLYAIARNRCLTMLRARREQPVDELADVAYDGLAAEVQSRQDLQDLVRDVGALPEDQRAALVLSELGDMSHEEIAAVIGCQKDKVKALVFQARSSLQTTRQARETSCEEIRELLANLRGGSLRRGVVSRHVKECAGCRAFQAEVKHQRQALAVIIPVIPAVGLKHSTLAAAFTATHGAGAAGVVAGGGVVAGSVAATGAGSALVTGAGALVAKGLVVAALAGGGVAAVSAVDGGPATPPGSKSGATAPGGSGGPAVPAVAPASEADDSATPGKRTRKRPHGNRRGHTDRGRDFALTRGKKLGPSRNAAKREQARARKEAHADARVKAKAKAKSRRKAALKKTKPIKQARPVSTPRPTRPTRPTRAPAEPTPEPTPVPTVPGTEEPEGRAQGAGSPQQQS